MATNNDGHLLDSAGNVAVDFAWGPFPLQPNDVRVSSPTSNATGGGRGTTALQTQSALVTAASADGTTVTYTAANSFTVGEGVSITGLSTGAFNLSNVLVASLIGTAGAYTGFTVTNAATGSGVSGATAVAKGILGSIPGVGADYGYGTTTDISSGYLKFPNQTITLNNGLTFSVPMDNHVFEQTAYSGYPAATQGAGNYIVTAASGDGTTVTYTSFNFLAPGDTINITGCSTSAFNLSSVTVATANRQSFTVTNAAGSGVSITGQYAKAESTTALTGNDGAFLAGVAYVDVPTVLGFTTALATDAMLDAELVPTTGAGATNTATQPTGVNVTTTTAATVTIAGGTSTWPVGTKVTIAAGTGIPTAVVGTWTVTGGSGSTLVIAGSGWTVANSGAITPGTVLTGATGTIKTQSIAVAAASIAIGAAVTVTPWA
jgi:hypothetical protein